MNSDLEDLLRLTAELLDQLPDGTHAVNLSPKSITVIADDERPDVLVAARRVLAGRYDPDGQPETGHQPYPRSKGDAATEWIVAVRGTVPGTDVDVTVQGTFADRAVVLDRLATAGSTT